VFKEVWWRGLGRRDGGRGGYGGGFYPAWGLDDDSVWMKEGYGEKE
jgi:hypothetical protein